ncbi:hypothetical protein CEXT_227641 [Caerostris extrusa]|uniref:Uncharacterized protein n=1 Tax=Caerostris extrusa TaxID=172846 RepID=A0AAV4QX34_CAEEX|nr:hypothetical protein CEXT_227641 [Caerostris extrusa]
MYQHSGPHPLPAANPTIVSQNGTAFHNKYFSANQHRGITAEGGEEAGAIQQSSSSRIFYSGTTSQPIFRLSCPVLNHPQNGSTVKNPHKEQRYIQTLLFPRCMRNGRNTQFRIRHELPNDRPGTLKDVPISRPFVNCDFRLSLLRLSKS